MSTTDAGQRAARSTGLPVVLTDEADLATCPVCRAPASLERGFWLKSTGGLVEHGRLRCAADCGWFHAPVDDLLVAGEPR
jgi:hypothetical protein